MQISLIVACGNAGQIGLDNKLLWHISKDLKNFKRLTHGHHILMGRKTYQSIGFPLPGRTSLVITRQENLLASEDDRLYIFDEIKKAIAFAKERGEGQLFIIGGGQIYNTAIDLVDKVYLSKVDFTGEADTFFDLKLVDEFISVNEVQYPAEEKTPAWTFCEMERLQ